MKSTLAFFLTAIIGFAAATTVFAQDADEMMDNSEMMMNSEMNSEEMPMEESMPAEEAAPEAPTSAY